MNSSLHRGSSHARLEPDRNMFLSGRVSNFAAVFMLFAALGVAVFDHVHRYFSIEQKAKK